MESFKQMRREYLLERLAQIENELMEIKRRIERRPTTSSAAVYIDALVNLCRLREKRRELREQLKTVEIDDYRSDIGYWSGK